MSTKTLTATKNDDCSPPLTGKLAPWMKDLIRNPGQLSKWLQSEGSPVHIVVTSEFKRNVKELLAPLYDRGISGGLFFARKANKLPCFVTAAKEEGIGIDTASLQELRETLKLGISPDQIVITAISKNQELVSQAIVQGCLLVIDNLDELQLVQSIAQTLGKTVRIGLRLSGFKVKEYKIFSRFGFPVSDWAEITNEIYQSPWLKLELLHAHLDRYDIEERISAARQLIELADNAAMLGHQIFSIDLGGGILVRYLEKEEEWKNFLNNLMASVSGERQSFTYLADGLGYYKIGQQIIGNADFYPAWNNLSKERFIAAILDDAQNGVPLHKEISARGLKLFFEPGRALLDNAGITLTSVSFRKRDTIGNLLIGTEMNRTNLHPFRTEFCIDPILLSTDHRKKALEGAFLVGNMCSESDLILKRKLRLTYLPQPGDIICFPNTAGYFAHLLETATHGNPLPKNILFNPDTRKISTPT